MKRLFVLALAVSSLILTPAALEAKAKPGKEGKGPHHKAELARFDKNKNGSLDGKEIQMARADFDAMKALDKNSNGQLEDSELASVEIKKAGKGDKKSAKNPGKKAGKKAKKAGGKGGKKGEKGKNGKKGKKKAEAAQ